jgi:hypothetical protein
MDKLRGGPLAHATAHKAAPRKVAAKIAAKRLRHEIAKEIAIQRDCGKEIKEIAAKRLRQRDCDPNDVYYELSSKKG